MSGRGRPLRFVALVAVGWVGARAATLWPPSGAQRRAVEARIPPADAGRPAPLPTAPIRIANFLVDPIWTTQPSPARRSFAPRPNTAPAVRVVELAGTLMAAPGIDRYGAVRIAGTDKVTLPEIAQPMTIEPMPQRWSASAWLAVRPGMGLGAAPGAGQLGGSQGGMRLSYLLMPERRVAAFARVAAPLAGKGAEGVVGLDWQPTRVPVRLVAEQRFGLDGTPGGTGLGVLAGIYAGVPAHFTLEAYGQAGAIRRARLEPYADGAARATRVVVKAAGARLALGGGIWGAAQRGAQRLDLGPSAILTIPLGHQNVRLALDWRQRVAGDARPGSGAALTIGGDF